MGEDWREHLKPRPDTVSSVPTRLQVFTVIQWMRETTGIVQELFHEWRRRKAAEAAANAIEEES